MTLAESRNSSSWQGAVELGPHLMRLAEELPAGEAMGLSFQLRQAMVEVPATVAAWDLLPEPGNNRILPVLKLLAVLDLIEKVYPALDTADVRADAEKLAESIVAAATGGDATAALPAKTGAPAVPAPPAAPHAATVPADVPLVGSDAAPHPAEVTVSHDGTITPAASPKATSVPVVAQSTSEESHVQPDSVQ